MSGVIKVNAGTLDKFMGDGILAFFNAPNPVPDHPAKACRAALQAIEKLKSLETTSSCRGFFRARIGLHTGKALVGNIGTPDRFAYTVIGDVVNLASRLERLNKIYGTRLMGSAALKDAAGNGFEWRLLDRVVVIGREETTSIYELLGEAGTVHSNVLRARDLYEKGLAVYWDRNFEKALSLFLESTEWVPTDRAAQLMASRCAEFQHQSPSEDWNGVYILASK